MTFTAAQLITRALQHIRVIGIGRALQEHEASVALPLLQELVEKYQIDHGLIYEVSRLPFTLVANQVSRTIGPTGNFSCTPRPAILVRASVAPVGSTLEQPVRVLSEQEYFNIQDKAEESEYPSAVRMRQGSVNNTLVFHPVPTTAATLYLSIPVGVTGLAVLSTEYTFPAGYHELFRTELEKKLAPAFGKPVTEEMMDAAFDAQKNVERINDDGPPDFISDGALTRGAGWFDIYSGEPR